MKELLEYDGCIPMISRWAQELLGYHFTVIHRPTRMMRDVDAITCLFGPIISHHMTIALILSEKDKSMRPDAYYAKSFKSSIKARVFGPTTENTKYDYQILTKTNVKNRLQKFMTTVALLQETNNGMLITTSPIM